MPCMKISLDTALGDEVRGGVQRLPAGTVLSVSDEMAKRWERHGVAVATDLKPGYYPDAEAMQTEADIDAQIERLEALKMSKRADAERLEAVAAAVAADEHPLGRYGLTERQRTALMRAGFTNPERIDAATNADLLEVDGVGERTLDVLRGKE